MNFLKPTALLAIACLSPLMAGCDFHDYSVDACVSLQTLENRYGIVVGATFSQDIEPDLSSFTEITHYSHERGILTEESEVRARKNGHIPNEVLPRHLDHFMAAHPRELIYQYHTLPIGADSGMFRSGPKGTHHYQTGIMRGFRKFRTRKYDMLMWKIPRKTAERTYELVEITFHYPLLLSKLDCNKG